MGVVLTTFAATQINKTCWKIVNNLVANKKYASFGLVTSILEERWGIRCVFKRTHGPN